MIGKDMDRLGLGVYSKEDMLSSPAEIAAIAGLVANGCALKLKRIAITSAPTGSEQDTGWDLPAKAVLLDVWLEATTAEATGSTKTVDVGLLSGESGGDADGFLVGAAVSATGVKMGVLTKGAETYGALLKYTITDNGSATHPQRRHHLAQAVTARSVSYTSGSAFTEFRGAIYLLYVEIA